MTDIQPDSKWDWIGRIETASNSYVDILCPDIDTLFIDDIAISLSNICRFNGHLMSFYSVAEHSVRVARWLIDKGCSLDVVMTGLLHDAAEAYVGDMMRPLKRIPEMEAVFKPIEERIIKMIHQKFGGIFPHPDIIHEADHAIYDWEVANIRDGLVFGKSPDAACSAFIELYFEITDMSEVTVMWEQQDVDINPINHRSQLLNEANNLVNGDRNVQYGDPTEDFKRTSVYWSTHIGGVFRRKMHNLGYTPTEEVLYLMDRLLDPHDVAIMIGQVKDSRLAWDPLKRDSWADKAGYAACGYDCVASDF